MLTASVENTVSSSSEITVVNSALAQSAPASTVSEITASAPSVTSAPAPAPAPPAPAASDTTPPPPPTVAEDININNNGKDIQKRLSYDQILSLLQVINNAENNAEILSRVLHTSSIVIDFREFLAAIYSDKYKDKDKSKIQKTIQNIYF